MKQGNKYRTLKRLSKGLTIFFMVLSILYAAFSFLIYGNDEGVQWFMWRDQPWIAITLLSCSLICGIMWRIMARISLKLEESNSMNN